MRAIRDTWMHYRSRHLKPELGKETTQEHREGIREEAALWDTFTSHIKKMLVRHLREPCQHGRSLPGRRREPDLGFQLL